MRSDENGMKYARIAWELSQCHELNPSAQCMAAVAMAEMCRVSLELGKAVEYLEYADSVSTCNSQLSQFAVINLLYAEIYTMNAVFEEAERKYDEA